MSSGSDCGRIFSNHRSIGIGGHHTEEQWNEPQANKIIRATSQQDNTLPVKKRPIEKKRLEIEQLMTAAAAGGGQIKSIHRETIPRRSVGEYPCMDSSIKVELFCLIIN
jgi:hypothetical protein